jgi:hypothetical protein
VEIPLANLVAGTILTLLGGYLAIGCVFALLFAVKGAPQLDHAARNAPWSFRVLILPGAAALWPILLKRWRAASRSRS